MGISSGSSKVYSNERDHDVHVRQHVTDVQYHDGFHVVQESNPSSSTD